MRRVLSLVLFGLAVGLGLGMAARIGRHSPPPPGLPTVLLRVREVARLETLTVSVYKKVSYAPGPAPADSFWGDVANWLRHTLSPPRGKAIVFAEAHMGFDLDRVGPETLRVVGRDVWLVLPPTRVEVELRPGETEIIGSNLDSAETAQLLELARTAFERELGADLPLRKRARDSAERAIRALLLELGFREVHFAEKLPSLAGS